MKESNTPIGRRLMKMASYPEYETILDIPGLAYEFNELCKMALGLEKLVLDHFRYRDQQSAKRAMKRKASK